MTLIWLEFQNWASILKSISYEIKSPVNINVNIWNKITSKTHSQHLDEITKLVKLLGWGGSQWVCFPISVPFFSKLPFSAKWYHTFPFPTWLTFFILILVFFNLNFQLQLFKKCPPQNLRREEFRCIEKHGAIV